MKTDIAGPGYSSRAQRTFTISGRLLEALHLDGPLLAAVLAVCVTGLVVLYSAAGEELGVFFAQAARLGLALGVLVAVAQVPPRVMRIGAPWLYLIGADGKILYSHYGPLEPSQIGPEVLSKLPKN